jgi:hypothetical protein
LTPIPPEADVTFRFRAPLPGWELSPRLLAALIVVAGGIYLVNCGPGLRSAAEPA